MQRLAAENLNTLAYWNERFQRDDYFDWPTENLAERIAALIPDGAHVLDVGTAMAWFPRQIREIRPDVTFSGCDFSPYALARLNERYPALFVEVRKWDVRDPLPLEAFKRYDVVLCTELIEHLEDPAAAIQRLVDAAKHRLILTTPNEARIPCQEHVWSYSVADLVELLAPYGTPKVEIARSGTSLIGAVDVA